MPSGKSIRVATRSSPLSIAQTDETILQLRKALPDHSFEIIAYSRRVISGKVRIFHV